MKLINIGFGNMVSAGRVVAVVSPDSAPVKRLVKEARERGMLIDASYGRSTRAVLIMDSDHVVLSALQPETVANRAGIPVERAGSSPITAAHFPRCSSYFSRLMQGPGPQQV